MTKLDVKGLGLAIGTLWAVCVLLMGLLSTWFDYGTGIVNLFSTIYIGYKATLQGSVVGAIYGFVDGFIGGALIAWLYNKFSK